MLVNQDLIISRFGKTLGEYSLLFRALAKEVDDNPEVIFQHLQQDAIRSLYTQRTLSAADFFFLYEALAYGDIGVLFAAPRTCLSGILLQFIGSSEQKEYYFETIKTQYLRSFFANTEPAHGSDANNMEMRFEINKAVGEVTLFGEKMLVGNLGFGEIGIVVGRINAGPLGINAILLTPEDFKNNKKAISRCTLPMCGIQPAQLGYAKFDGFTVPHSQLLGQQNSAMERGLQSVIKTFNIMRLGITGLALGHAQAILDYVMQARKSFSVEQNQQISLWQQELLAIRQLAIGACEHNQQNRIETSLISLVKVRSSRLIEKIATKVLSFFGAEIIFEHPYLVKTLRDCFGYEFMDGTTNIQRKNVYQGFSHANLSIR